MTHIAPLELEHCKEIAMPPGSLFEFTSRYLSTVRQQQLLALYALIQSLGSIPNASTDDSVRWAKLKWWNDELLAEPDSPSRHPVVRALWQSGARQWLDNSLLLRLVSDALMQIDVTPDAHENAMYERLAAKGETGILLELALDGVRIKTPEFKKLAAASGLFGMVSGLSVDRPSEKIRLPLDLLARYQLTSNHFEQDPPGVELLAAVTHLANCGIGWFSQSSPGLDGSTGLHLRLRWAMEERLLSRLGQNAGKNFRRANRFGPSDAWFAWRYYRNLRRV